MWISKKEYNLYQQKALALEKENAALKSMLETKNIWEKAYNKAVTNEDLLLTLLGKNKKEAESYFTVSGGTITGATNIMGVDFDKDVAVYVNDYFGGKVIKQESIKVVILDKDGKATYSQTARTNKKSDFQRNYVLVEAE